MDYTTLSLTVVRTGRDDLAQEAHARFGGLDARAAELILRIRQTMKQPRLTFCLFIFSVLLVTPALLPEFTNAQSRSAQPIKTVNRDGATVSYYENPSAVAVAATFYVIGSQRNFRWRDFLALSAAFVVRGQTVTEPDSVKVHFVSSTRTKGGKYVANHRLTILTDGNVLLETDLAVAPAGDNERGGKIEFLEVPPIPFKQFTALSLAKEVRMRLGNTEFKLKKKHLEALRSMLKSVNS
jgi:hypothetical protein